MRNKPLNKNSITFRFATSKDATALSELATSTFYEAFASSNTKEDMLLYTSKTFSVAQLTAELQEEHATCILVFDVEVLIGYVRLKKSNGLETNPDESALEIERFYIRATHTNQHIGSMLMQECIHYAIEKRLEVIILGVWEHNHRAIAFYRKWGFTHYGSHPFLLGNDLQTDLLMKKYIN